MTSLELCICFSALLMISAILPIDIVNVSYMYHVAGSTVIQVPEDYPTIKGAVAAASLGDTIIVAEGIYPEGIIPISKSLTLIANGTVTVDGLHQGNVFTIYEDNVTIKGFSITNSKLEYPYCGIHLMGVQNCVIEANNVTNCHYGIELSYSQNNTVIGNTATNTHEAIELFYSDGNNIRDNKLKNNHYGIPIDKSDGNNITDNDIENNVVGIGLLSASSGNKISRNNVENNRFSIKLLNSNGNTIIHNNVTNNYWVSMSLTQSNTNNILDNNFTNSWYGVWLNASSYNNLTRNTVTGAKFGFLLWRSQNNVLRCNNMSANKYNFGVWGPDVTFFLHDIDTSNTVNGKPIYYLLTQSNIAINASTFPDIGFLAVINSTNITVENLKLTGNYVGLSFAGTTNSTLQNLKVSNNNHGFLLVDCKNNSMVDNHVSNNGFGIRLYNSGGNFLRNNNMSGNLANFGVEGEALSHYVQDIDTSNLVDGKPVYYWVNESSGYVPLDAGFVAAINCTNITVQNLNLTNNCQGVLFAYTKNCIIQNTYIANNLWSGIWLWASNHNTVRGNTITNATWDGLRLQMSENNTIQGNTIESSWRGMLIYQSNNNMIYHNNFINNTNQVHIEDMHSVNIWSREYPYGGNYWSNYDAPDANKDGIGDSPYQVAPSNLDNFPLKGAFYSFNTSLGRHVNVISNSTIEDFLYFESNKTIKMHVSNTTANQTYGFCRIRIPYALMTEPYHVTINGANPTYWNYTLYDDGHNRWIYFSYQHSTIEIDIIPEFLSLIVLPLFMTATLLAVIVYKRKHYL